MDKEAIDLKVGEGVDPALVGVSRYLMLVLHLREVLKIVEGMSEEEEKVFVELFKKVSAEVGNG